MSKFSDTMAQIREFLKSSLTNDNIEQTTNASKQLDTLEAEYNAREKEVSEAKDNLVKYVKEYAFDKPGEDTTHTGETPSLDDLIAKEFQETKK